MSLQESLKQIREYMNTIGYGDCDATNHVTKLLEVVRHLADAAELAQGKLQESINGQHRKFYDEADKDMRLAKSFIDAGLRQAENIMRVEVKWEK